MSKLKDHGCTINEHITSLDGNSCECGYFTHQLIQAHTNAEIAKAKLEAFDVAFDCHDYDRLRAYRAELLKNGE